MVRLGCLLGIVASLHFYSAIPFKRAASSAGVDVAAPTVAGDSDSSGVVVTTDQTTADTSTTFQATTDLGSSTGKTTRTTTTATTTV